MRVETDTLKEIVGELYRVVQEIPSYCKEVETSWENFSSCYYQLAQLFDPIPNQIVNQPKPYLELKPKDKVQRFSGKVEEEVKLVEVVSKDVPFLSLQEYQNKFREGSTFQSIEEVKYCIQVMNKLNGGKVKIQDATKPSRTRKTSFYYYRCATLAPRLDPTHSHSQSQSPTEPHNQLNGTTSLKEQNHLKLAKRLQLGLCPFSINLRQKPNHPVEVTYAHLEHWHLEPMKVSTELVPYLIPTLETHPSHWDRLVDAGGWKRARNRLWAGDANPSTPPPPLLPGLPKLAPRPTTVALDPNHLAQLYKPTFPFEPTHLSYQTPTNSRNKSWDPELSHPIQLNQLETNQTNPPTLEKGVIPEKEVHLPTLDKVATQSTDLNHQLDTTDLPLEIERLKDQFEPDLNEPI